MVAMYNRNPFTLYIIIVIISFEWLKWQSYNNLRSPRLLDQ